LVDFPNPPLGLFRQCLAERGIAGINLELLSVNQRDDTSILRDKIASGWSEFGRKSVEFGDLK
jgi:hypothetical protein